MKGESASVLLFSELGKHISSKDDASMIRDSYKSKIKTLVIEAIMNVDNLGFEAGKF